MLGDGRRRERFTVRLDAELMAEAEVVGVNVQAACETGIRQRIAESRQWLEENREAIQENNRWVEEHGPPLAKYRQYQGF